MKRLLFILQLLFLLISFFPTSAFGITNSELSERGSLEWRNIDVDGHRAAAFTLFADSRGLMWVGTSQGLFLYDGAETHRIGDSVLTSIQVFAIVEHEGILYLGTNRGLMVYLPDAGKVDTTLSEPSVGEIRCMLTSHDKLLIGSLNGLFTYDFNSRKLEDIGRGLPNKSVYALLRDSRGVLYAGTTGGLARYDVSESRFRPVETPTLKSVTQKTFVNSMLEAPDRQSLYIGTGEGLFAYQPAREQWSRVEEIGNAMVKCLAINRKGRLLVGTYDGLFYLNSDGTHVYQRDTRRHTSPAGNQIWTVMEDVAGNIWTGHERGISIASNSSYFRSIKINSLIPTGESNEFLSVFRDSKSNLWLGGTNGVIVKKADGSVRWHHLASSNGTSGDICVRSIMEDSQGTVWLSTDGGIYRYNASTATFSVFLLSDTKGERTSDWVYAIRQIGDHLWVASYLGGINSVSLSKMTGNGGLIKADYSLARGQVTANDNISNMVADNHGCLWILLYGDQNLYRYNTFNHQADRYDIRQMVGSGPTHICLDKKGRLWCASKGGVVVFSGKGNPDVITLPPSGSDESVLAMAPVDDGVWLSTMSNLWNIDGKTLVPSLIPAPQKGLTSICDDPVSGKVIVGSLDEIVYVSKVRKDEAQNIGLVKMILECVDGHIKNLINLVTHSKALSIPYGGSLSLLVSTMEYSPDMMPHFQYRVVKHGTADDDGWVVMPEGTSAIHLTDMSFGDYELQVKTVSNPLPPVIVPLRVGKPFWLSWWAVMCYALLVAAATGAVFWYMRRRALRRAQEREREEALANVEQKLAFLSVEKHDLETRIDELLKAKEEMHTHQRLQAITDAKPIEAESPVEKQLAEIAKVVDENLSNLDLNGAFIGEQCAMSEKQLYRLMKKHLGITPSEYIRNVRMQKATMLLSQKYFTVSEVAYMVGFSAPSYFSKCFQEHYGVAPSNYQT